MRRLCARRRASRDEKRRIAALQAVCDHDWELIETLESEEYATFRAAMVPTGSAIVLKYRCRKCGKVRLGTFQDPSEVTDPGWPGRLRQYRFGWRWGAVLLAAVVGLYFLVRFVLTLFYG